MQTRKISGVLRVCADNPRYFTDSSGKAIYLTGSHTWNALTEQVAHGIFDYDSYLDTLVRCNHNFFRLWSLELFRTPEGDYEQLPWPRSGSGKALDGKPRFDLSGFNEFYFDRLRQRVKQAAELGIYVAVMLFEGWWITQFGEEGWSGHPFHPLNNTQALPLKRLEWHSLDIPWVVSLQEAYLRKVVDTVNDLDNVLVEIANEDGGGSLEWQSHLLAHLKSYEKEQKPKQHPVGMTFRFPGGTNEELFESDADWISPNASAPAGYNYKDNPPPATGSKIVIADTDHIYSSGLGSDWVWKCFTRGLNPILMEGWDFFTADPPARRAMGHTLAYARRIDLAHMDPDEVIASTGYALSHRGGREFIGYQPQPGPFTLDLTGWPFVYRLEWFNPVTEEVVVSSQTVAGGSTHTLTPPWQSDAVAYLVSL